MINFSKGGFMLQQSDVEHLIGMSIGAAQSYAESRNWRNRILMTDGQGHMKTNDVRSDRVNFYVASGVVVKVSVG